MINEISTTYTKHTTEKTSQNTRHKTTAKLYPKAETMVSFLVLFNEEEEKRGIKRWQAGGTGQRALRKILEGAPHKIAGGGVWTPPPYRESMENLSELLRYCIRRREELLTWSNLDVVHKKRSALSRNAVRRFLIFLETKKPVPRPRVRPVPVPRPALVASKLPRAESLFHADKEDQNTNSCEAAPLQPQLSSDDDDDDFHTPLETPTEFCLPMKTIYTANECKDMPAKVILSEFERITGHNKLRCRHCGPRAQFIQDGFYPIRERWSAMLREWCMKHGIKGGMNVPATCDVQKEKNDRSNPINNKFHAEVNKCATHEQRVLLDRRRVEMLVALGVSARMKTDGYWSKHPIRKSTL